jgi:hypothetical protein
MEQLNMKEKFTRWDPVDSLETEEDLALCLDACLEEDSGDGELVRASPTRNTMLAWRCFLSTHCNMKFATGRSRGHERMYSLMLKQLSNQAPSRDLHPSTPLRPRQGAVLRQARKQETPKPLFRIIR